MSESEMVGQIRDRASRTFYEPVESLMGDLECLLDTIDQQRVRIASLEAELVTRSAQTLDQQRQRIAELEAALALYADQANWRIEAVRGDPETHQDVWHAPIAGWMPAQEALTKERT